MLSNLLKCLHQLTSGFFWGSVLTTRNAITYGITKTILILQYMFLAMVCIIIDYSLKFPIINNNDYSRGLVDNMGHALIGGVSWLIVVGIHREGILQAAGCAAMSSLIDLDHFVMARSFQLKNALSLPRRPPLHTTTILLFIVPILQAWCVQNIPCLHYLPYMFTVAVLSHHLRDAHRRGLWFWPVGTTPPLPYWVYISCVVILPIVVRDAIEAIETVQKSDLGIEPPIKHEVQEEV